MIARRKPLLDALRPQLRNHSRDEYRGHADVSRAHEFIRSPVAHEQTFSGGQPKYLQALLIDRPFGFGAANHAREHFGVEQPGERAIVPRGDFHRVGVADQSESKTSGPKALE